MNKIYFFNAANFNFAEIDLKKKNVFFVGDNGSGKTTAIRAIHYYYNSDMKALGIDPNKESFKDFYFKYDNSFIVYEFDDYFVLMYKRRGEIKKRFSHQKFDINRVLKGDEIVPLEEVINYAKEAGSYMPQTNDEFKKIIYGLDRRHLDFKLTSIKNYNTFINLYNKIFNVNKAVFDAKSIKETIFTTLDRIEAGEIEYEDFLERVNNFRQYFIFYKSFKLQESNIEKLYLLKNDLIKLQEEINDLIKKISYKKEIEEKEVDKIIEKIGLLEKRKRNLNKIIGLLDKKIKNYINCFDKEILKLNSQLEEINKLKEKFSLEKLQKVENKVNKKEEINSKLIIFKTSLNELMKGIKSQVDEIEEAINRLKREIRILKEEIKAEEIRLKRNLEEMYQQKIEEKNEEFIKREKELIENIEKLEKETENFVEKRNVYQKELNDVSFKYREIENDLKKEFENRFNELNNEIKNLKREKENLEDENYKLKRILKKLKDELNENIEKTEIYYKKELSEIDKKITFYQNILKTKPNSFKEFLAQNVENWEEELYPVIDENLLNMDINELKPKVVSERIFGIELNKAVLKSIPTMKEAEEEIEKLNDLKTALNEEKIQKINILKKDYESKEIEITSQIEVNNEKIKEIEEKIELLENEKNELNKKLQKDLEKLKNKKNEEEKLIKINISKTEAVIKDLRDKIENIRREIKRNKKELENIKKELLKQKEKEFIEKKEILKKEYKEKEKLKNEKINELTQKKEKISKDERIIELQKEIENLKNKLKEIEKAEYFLREYNEKKEFIEKLPVIKENIGKFETYKQRINQTYEKLYKKLNNKINKTEININELNKKLEIIKEGLKKVSGLNLSDEKIETNEYLSNLVDEYKLKDGEFRDKKLSFKEVASKIKTALNRFAITGLEVNFNIEKLSDLIKDELEKVDELYLFKNKKFEVLNKTRLKELKNLLGGLLEKRLDNFERSKEDFINQVRRINQNLSKVNFGIIRNIKIELEENKKSVLKIFENIKKDIDELLEFLAEESLFFDNIMSERKLKKIEEAFNTIKKEINKESFSLIDVVDINVKFIENEKENTLKVIKNESSTGGSILLKIAIAVSLLELFIKEKADLFLILDEVSVLSTKNQKLLKEYVNERGLGVIYVTPDLPLVDVEGIDIYKFRNIGGEFEVVKLIADDGIKIEN
ncbi:ATP-binding protein [Lebetimonas natsushimae]|nr:ATP-binding protein [Lebetimonas natsushimae]